MSGCTCTCLRHDRRSICDDGATDGRNVVMYAPSSSEISRFTAHLTEPANLHSLFVFAPVLDDEPNGLQEGPSADSAFQARRREYVREVAALLNAVAPEIEKLCLVQWDDRANSLRGTHPLIVPGVRFPRLRVLMLVGGGIKLSPDALTAGNAGISFPVLERLHLVAHTIEYAAWTAQRAPRLAHVRVDACLGDGVAFNVKEMRRCLFPPENGTGGSMTVDSVQIEVHPLLKCPVCANGHLHDEANAETAVREMPETVLLVHEPALAQAKVCTEHGWDHVTAFEQWQKTLEAEGGANGGEEAN